MNGTAESQALDGLTLLRCDLAEKTTVFSLKNCFLLREAAFATHKKAEGPVESGLQTF